MSIHTPAYIGDKNRQIHQLERITSTQLQKVYKPQERILNQHW